MQRLSKKEENNTKRTRTTVNIKNIKKTVQGPEIRMEAPGVFVLLFSWYFADRVQASLHLVKPPPQCILPLSNPIADFKNIAHTLNPCLLGFKTHYCKNSLDLSCANICSYIWYIQQYVLISRETGRRLDSVCNALAQNYVVRV